MNYEHHPPNKIHFVGENPMILQFGVKGKPKGTEKKMSPLEYLSSYVRNPNASIFRDEYIAKPHESSRLIPKKERSNTQEMARHRGRNKKYR